MEYLSQAHVWSSPLNEDSALKFQRDLNIGKRIRGICGCIRVSNNKSRFEYAELAQYYVRQCVLSE